MRSASCPRARPATVAPHRHARRRSRRGRRRPVGHADACRRDRLLARRRHRRRRRSAAGRRPVRGDDRLDGRRARCCRAAPTGSSSARRPSRRRSTQPKYQINVNTHGASRGQDARAQRDRRRRISRPTSRSCSSPMPTTATLGGFILIDKLTNATVAAGMIHFCAAPRAERPLAGARRQPRGACRAQEPEAGGAVVHRPLGLGQVDHRQPGREEAARG